MLKAHALRKGAHDIAALIGPIETSLDETLALQASLLARVPAVRTEAGLPRAAAHDAILRLVASINAVTQAQTEFLAAQKEFASVGDDLRIKEMGFGSLPGCPESATLRVVETQAA